MDTSDEPYGLLTVAPSSLTTEERHQTVNIYVNREFGASGLYAEKGGEAEHAQLQEVEHLFWLCAGAVNISYEVTAGALRDLTPSEGALADPGLDFISGSGSVILQDGQTSVAIPVTIMEVKAEEPTLKVFRAA